MTLHGDRLCERPVTARIRRDDRELLLLDSRLADRVGRAGGLTLSARSHILSSLVSAVGACVVAGVLVGSFGGVRGVFAGAAVGLYAGALGAACGLGIATRKLERTVLFELPLFLDTLVLAVEAGCAILPAIAQVVAIRRDAGKRDPVTIAFDSLCALVSRGMPLRNALQEVGRFLPFRALQHALIHLDIAATDGGAIIPSIRSLADTAHSRWRMSVDARVRRLENYSVFPVFVAVMGLMLLMAALPVALLLNSSRPAFQPSFAQAALTEGTIR